MDGQQSFFFLKHLCRTYVLCVAAVGGAQELYVHANRAAPRCLPCNYTDPAESSFDNPSYQYIAPKVGAPHAAYGMLSCNLHSLKQSSLRHLLCMSASVGMCSDWMICQQQQQQH